MTFQHFLNLCVVLSLGVNSWLLFRLGQEAQGINERLDKVETVLDDARTISSAAREAVEAAREGELPPKGNPIRDRVEQEAKRKLEDLLRKL